MIKVIKDIINNKFNIPTDDSPRTKLRLIRWCLDNDLIQQALTIYNETAAEIVVNEKMISADSSYDDKLQKAACSHPNTNNGILQLHTILLDAFKKCKIPKAT